MSVSSPEARLLPSQQQVPALARVWARPAASAPERRYSYDEAHCRQVAGLALSLFDQTRQTHGMGTWERRYLEMAALLHDAGRQICRQGRHKHTYELICRAGLRDFAPQEVELIALIARYHRRSRPSKRHREYRRLPRELRRLVRRLAAILRVADGLDRGHGQNVRLLQVRWLPGRCQVELVTERDPGLEVWAALRRAALFRREFGRPLVFAAEAAAVERANLGPLPRTRTLELPAP